MSWFRHREAEQPDLMDHNVHAGETADCMSTESEGSAASPKDGSTVTLYPGNEAERAALEVPLQAEFTGPSYVLPSDIASILCSDLGLASLLSRMNDIMQTNYVLSPSRESLLQHCLTSFHDFGLAYALLRPRWHMDPSAAMEDIQTCQNADRKIRHAALRDDIVVDPSIQPRRIWDLWSNRVVPLWMTTPYQGERHKTFFAVSHSWMDDELRKTVDTPIYGHQWPVPIPADTTLERVRVELLNYTSKLDMNLVWLDVLCLRQVGPEANENLRLDEWKLDVPTSGSIYPDSYRTVYYYSVLGRPFEAGDFNSPRHWQNRAWTLQETNPNRIIGGISARSPPMPGLDTPDLPVDEAIRPLYEKIDAWEAFSHVVDSIYAVLDAMRHRSATRELDKIAGLNYYLAKFSPLPAYIQNEDPEDAWNRLMLATHSMQRADLFFLFPEPGNGKHVWCPSWQQIKDARTLPQQNTIRQYVDLDDNSVYSISGHRVDGCCVEGLADLGNDSEDGRRTGRVLITDEDGTEHTITVIAGHMHVIADGRYTLIAGRFYPNHWVIGRSRGPDLVEKVSVIRVEGVNLVRKLIRLSEDDVVSRLV